MRKKRAFFASDDEMAIIKAAAKTRSVSEFVLSCALSEAKRHKPSEGLEDLIRRMIQEELSKLLPAPGNASDEGFRYGVAPIICPDCGAAGFKVTTKIESRNPRIEAHHGTCAKCDRELFVERILG